MAYGDFKVSIFKYKDSFWEKLSDKAFNIAKYPKYDGNQRGLTSIVYKSFDKKICISCKVR